jgi:hypothetical protein
MATVTQIGPRLGIAPTCAALGLPRASYYRGAGPRGSHRRGGRRPARSVRASAVRSSPCCMHRASWIWPRLKNLDENGPLGCDSERSLKGGS